jgi:two-component system sensor histidine kinase PilS (NtrC family)
MPPPSPGGGPQPERRRTERRQGDRRGAPTRTKAFDESWFGALGGASGQGGDASDAGPSSVGDDVSRFGTGWGALGETPDSRFLTRQARRLVDNGHTAFQRIYRMFAGARAAVGLALLLAMVAGSMFGMRVPLPAWGVTAAYAVLTIATWAAPQRMRPFTPDPAASRLRGASWAATVGLDLTLFSVLHLFEPGSSLNYAALLVLPVLMASVLMPRLSALATSAAAALVLLAGAWRAALGGGDLAGAMTQAGMAGAGFFVVTLLASELAARLAREELTARGSLEVARQQAQLNRLVIEEMGEGVLVIDRRSRVRTINPAARHLLATQAPCPAAPFSLQGDAAWRPLVEAVEQAFREGSWPDTGRDVPLAGASPRTLRVRMRFSRRRTGAGDREGDAGEEFCVLFIEDLLTIHARTRQEKLAAMGRVSAGIAHEIRNPLAAISQANALLREDALSPDQQRLAAMVADNVERLKRIVDDVMAVASGTAAAAPVIDARAEIDGTVQEWLPTVGVASGGRRLALRLPDAPLPVRFDPHHLRRVVINLLDNAWRHATDQPGAVAVEMQRIDPALVELRVASDGPAIPAEVERHLFEPFFSTRSRGTGLGLYICRELCDRYGARIEYRAGLRAGRPINEFVVTLRAAPGLQEPKSG